MIIEKVLKNAAECPLCHEIIESTHRHDFKRCSCGNIVVDGGLDYLKRMWRDQPPIEKSEVEEVEVGEWTIDTGKI